MKLAHPPKNPTIHQVRQAIRDQIRIHAASFREQDGVIRNEWAVQAIGCLQKALKLLPLPGRHQERRRKR